MNGVVFLPDSVQEKKKMKRLFIKRLIVFLISNIFLLLFFYVPYHNLVLLKKQNNNLMHKYSETDQDKTKQQKNTEAYKKKQQLSEIVGLIEKEKQTVGANLNIFKNINSKNICIETISYENNKISIQGKATNYYIIINFLKFININKLYSVARISKIDYLEQNKTFVFQLSIKLKGEV